MIPSVSSSRAITGLCFIVRKILGERLIKALTPYRTWLARLTGKAPAIAPDIGDWVDSTGIGQRLGSVAAPEQVHRTLPANHQDEEPGVQAIFSENQTYSTYARPVVQVPGALLCGSEGFLRLPDGRYCLQTTWYPQQITLHPDYYRQKSRPVVNLPGTYFSLVFYWSTQYYHWLTEDLPLLHGLSKFLPPSTRYIIPGPPSRFHVATLELLGIGPDRCIAYDGLASWRLENLIFSPPATTSFAGLTEQEIYADRFRLHHPTHFTGPFNHTPEAIRWLAATMNDSAHQTSLGRSNPRLYISRAKANCRRIVNAPEFEALLTSFGFHTCFLEDLSVVEQIQLFHQAEMVVGPHGAGLSNLMFCRPGTRVIEIFEPSVVRLCYWSISSSMELSYWCHFGKGNPVPGLDPDIFIDLAEFTNCLNQADSVLRPNPPDDQRAVFSR